MRTILFIIVQCITISCSFVTVCYASTPVTLNCNVDMVLDLSVYNQPAQSVFTLTNTEYTAQPFGFLNYLDQAENNSPFNVVIKCNSSRGMRLLISGQGAFNSASIGRQLPVDRIKWSSTVGAKNNLALSNTAQECFTQSSEGIVTDNMQFRFQFASTDPAAHDYKNTIILTAESL